MLPSSLCALPRPSHRAPSHALESSFSLLPLTFLLTQVLGLGGGGGEGVPSWQFERWVVAYCVYSCFRGIEGPVTPEQGVGAVPWGGARRGAGRPPECPSSASAGAEAAHLRVVLSEQAAL